MTDDFTLRQFDFFQSQYQHEFELKEKLTLRAQVTFAAIFTVATGALYICRSLDIEGNKFLIGSISSFMLISGFCLVFATFLACRSFTGYNYQYLPTSRKTKSYIEDLEKYNASVYEYNKTDAGKSCPQETVVVQRKFEEYLINSLVECSTHNATLNETKAGYIYKSLRWLSLSGLFLFISGLVFVACDMDAASPRKETRRLQELSATRSLN